MLISSQFHTTGKETGKETGKDTGSGTGTESPVKERSAYSSKSGT